MNKIHRWLSRGVLAPWLELKYTPEPNTTENMEGNDRIE